MTTNKTSNSDNATDADNGPAIAGSTQPVDDSCAASSTDGSGPVVDVDIDELRSQNDALRDKWMRTQAELENYRARAQKELQDARRFESFSLGRDLLPALDNLGRAVTAAETTGNVSELIDGIGMVIRQFDDILSRHFIKKVESEGQPFDPNRHQALQQVPSHDHPPMTVLQEVEAGYQMHDRVVRPSSVIVSGVPPAATDGASDADARSNA